MVKRLKQPLNLLNVFNLYTQYAEVAQLAVDFHFEVREVENLRPEAFRDRAYKPK
jgi:hypothetical protein